MTTHVFNRTFEELDALAKEAVSQAVDELHAKGIPTYHMENGQMIETAPNGTRRVVDHECIFAKTRDQQNISKGSAAVRPHSID